MSVNIWENTGTSYDDERLGYGAATDGNSAERNDISYALYRYRMMGHIYPVSGDHTTRHHHF